MYDLMTHITAHNYGEIQSQFPCCIVEYFWMVRNIISIHGSAASLFINNAPVTAKSFNSKWSTESHREDDSQCRVYFLCLLPSISLHCCETGHKTWKCGHTVCIWSIKKKIKSDAGIQAVE